MKHKSSIIIPKGYKPTMTVRETIEATEFIKGTYTEDLSKALNLTHVPTAPILETGRGYQDNLTGVEKPVGFRIPSIDTEVEIPQSLAKWKRNALKEYGFNPYEGIVVNGSFFRADEELDNTHSVFVDQWDWERVLKDSDLNEKTLRDTVSKIHEAMVITQDKALTKYPKLSKTISEKPVSFITAQELEYLYPDLEPGKREDEYVKHHPYTFIQGIGHKMESGLIQSIRSPDFDNWDLNGDIVVHNPVLDKGLELSSMGIRVTKNQLLRQCEIAGKQDRLGLEYHQKVLRDELPKTIGGGIGQSRFAMQLLGAAHLGQVQVMVHDPEVIKRCEEAGIELL